MVGRWNFLLKSSLFSGDVNFQVPRYPQRGKYEETKAREHRQVSSPGILGCLVFFPLPNLPAGLPFRSAKDELARREATLSWVFFWKTGIIKCPGEVLGHHFVWLGFRVSPFFWWLMTREWDPNPGGGFNFFEFSPLPGEMSGKWSNLPNMFQMGGNHELVMFWIAAVGSCWFLSWNTNRRSLHVKKHVVLRTAPTNWRAHLMNVFVFLGRFKLTESEMYWNQLRLVKVSIPNQGGLLYELRSKVSFKFFVEGGGCSIHPIVGDSRC